MIRYFILFISFFVFPLFITYAEDDFCDGYEEGYKSGYCYGEPNSIRPVAPLCPIPDINESTYQDGYNRGFTEGLADKHKF